MPSREMIDISENYTEHINVICGQNEVSFSPKPDGT
jgi:hypothetical protein